MSPVELHRAWMVPLWVVKQGGHLNIPGGTTALLTWQYLLPQELSKKAKKNPKKNGICLLVMALLFWLHPFGMQSVKWTGGCSPVFVTSFVKPFIWIPKMASFDLPQDCRNFQAHFCFPVFFPVSAWPWWWWCYFAGFKCHSLKLELFTFFQVSPKE